MDEDWDWDPDPIVDLDVTGDPQLDQFGYQSPRRNMGHRQRRSTTTWRHLRRTWTGSRGGGRQKKRRGRKVGRVRGVVTRGGHHPPRPRRR
jgi:hypothetical protein